MSGPLAGIAGSAGSGKRLGMVADALAVHFEPEAFAAYAARELAAVGLPPRGRCQWPDCSRSFNPRRAWQAYCSDACRDADTREMRLWGHRAAPALLVWRQYKYATDPAQAALARAARRYVTQLQSAWAASRRDRVARAMGAGCGG